jgi:nucleotide-binding universal stress UspA family protein
VTPRLEEVASFQQCACHVAIADARRESLVSTSGDRVEQRMSSLAMVGARQALAKRKESKVDFVVGYIFGTEARAALQRAILEAEAHDARLVVVHSSKGGLDVTDEEEQAYSEELARIDDLLTTSGIDHEVREFVLGHEPAEDIVEIAREKKADMIVIGVRRRSRTGKFILGSVAQDVILAADCPVLAVKAEFGTADS